MFEILFKYPASLFHKGQFVLLTPWPVWVLVIGILAVAGAMFWNVRRSHGMLSGARPIAIWILQTCLMALILFLLWHPALSVATLRPNRTWWRFCSTIRAACRSKTRPVLAKPRPRTY